MLSRIQQGDRNAAPVGPVRGFGNEPKSAEARARRGPRCRSVGVCTPVRRLGLGRRRQRRLAGRRASRGTGRLAHWGGPEDPPQRGVDSYLARCLGGHFRRVLGTERAGAATKLGPRAVSSAGRAPALQAGGRWFEPGTAHLPKALLRRGFCIPGRKHSGREWERCGNTCAPEAIHPSPDGCRGLHRSNPADARPREEDGYGDGRSNGGRSALRQDPGGDGGHRATPLSRRPGSAANSLTRRLPTASA